MKRLLIIIATPILVCVAAWLAGFDFSTRGVSATITFVYSITATWFAWFFTKECK